GSRDLVFSQISVRATGERPDLTSLHASFGDAFGLPTPPVDLGDVGDIASAFRARVIEPGTLPTGLDDIFVRSAETTGYFRFRGSTDRALQSPLDLARVCDGGAALRG